MSIMTEIIQFLGHHWLLTTGISVLLVLLLINEVVASYAMKLQLNTQEMIQMMNHHHAVVIDIRDKGSFDKGHIQNAIHVPVAQLKEKTSLIDNYKKKPLILVCETGIAALKMVRYLKSADFEEVYCLAGGMTAWQKDNLPVL